MKWNEPWMVRLEYQDFRWFPSLMSLCPTFVFWLMKKKILFSQIPILDFGLFVCWSLVILFFISRDTITYTLTCHISMSKLLSVNIIRHILDKSSLLRWSYRRHYKRESSERLISSLELTHETVNGSLTTAIRIFKMQFFGGHSFYINTSRITGEKL